MENIKQFYIFVLSFPQLFVLNMIISINFTYRFNSGQPLLNIHSYGIRILRDIQKTASGVIQELFLLVKNEQIFLYGYFESSVSMERSENNRVQFNMTYVTQATDSLRTWTVIPEGKSHTFAGWDK